MTDLTILTSLNFFRSMEYVLGICFLSGDGIPSDGRFNRESDSENHKYLRGDPMFRQTFCSILYLTGRNIGISAGNWQFKRSSSFKRQTQGYRSLQSENWDLAAQRVDFNQREV